MEVDNASPEVIVGTDNCIKDYVRFYFRPRTPTQYRNEGIRPISERKLGAHCPVPVFFIFKSVAILTRKGTLFSNGNLGSHDSITGGSVDFLQKLPFRKIYHIGAYDKNVDLDIKFYRNAEVIVPDDISLELLHRIVCRSEAEKETLINLLPEETKKKWITKIIYKPELALFEKKWTFVEKVMPTENSIKIYFSPDTQTPSPFHAILEIKSDIGKKFTWEEDNFVANSKIKISFPFSLSKYSAELYLDDSLACKIKYKKQLIFE
jgi:hypothetical protein